MATIPEEGDDMTDGNYCKHGTYVGTPHGPDHMCGWCEDGTEPEPTYSVVGADGAIILPGPFTLAQAESLAATGWTAGYEYFTSRMEG
jgi:hypothetical protein